MRYLFLLFVLFFSGCSVSEYIDVSDELRFSKVIGKRYQLLKPLKLHADLVDEYKSKKLWSYTISTGYKNRYVLWQKHIPRNTIIKVKKAFIYGSHLFNDVAYSVEIEDSLFNLNDNLPIHLDSLLNKQENDYIVLDPVFLKELKSYTPEVVATPQGLNLHLSYKLHSYTPKLHPRG